VRDDFEIAGVAADRFHQKSCGDVVVAPQRGRETDADRLRVFLQRSAESLPFRIGEAAFTAKTT
jgi:hypothetical protein